MIIKSYDILYNTETHEIWRDKEGETTTATTSKRVPKIVDGTYAIALLSCGTVVLDLPYKVTGDDVVVDGAGFGPAASAMPTLRSYQTDLPAQA